MKISFCPKIVKNYCMKNTVSARYERQLAKANVSGLMVAGEALRISQWETCDIGIMSALCTILLKSISDARSLSKELEIIEKRAKNIHKLSKLNKQA